MAPRHRGATAALPGDPAFWQLALDECDNFAFKTARDSQGGPFGAQLWLFHPDRDECVLVGTGDHRQDANAVLKRGNASAHAEAESLRPENRARVIAFLEKRAEPGWRVVQLSSGESCPSCRAKQTLFALELVARGLIAPGDFHVAFKTTYQQTAAIAGFSDAPMDRTLGAILEMGLLQSGGVLTFEEAVAHEPGLIACMSAAEMLPLVTGSGSLAWREAAKPVLEQAGNRPCAVILDRNAQAVLSWAVDARSAQDRINLPEKTAILGALYNAAAEQKRQGDPEPWKLKGARLVTNFKHIGPTAFAECLWFDIGEVYADSRLIGADIEVAAAEYPGLDNKALFAMVAGPYNTGGAPIATTHLGDGQTPSIAHLYWQAHRAREALLREQAQRREALGAVRTSYIDGKPLSLTDLAECQTTSTHYDPG